MFERYFRFYYLTRKAESLSFFRAVIKRIMDAINTTVNVIHGYDST